MIRPVHAPRVNNNDDIVRVGRILISPGGTVRSGDPIVEIETDKAMYVVEAETDGVVLKVLHDQGDEVPVGTILAWLGSESGDQVPPEYSADHDTHVPGCHAPAEATAKAKLLLELHQLSAAEIPHDGSRLTAADVEAYITKRGTSPPPPEEPQADTPGVLPPPRVPGVLEDLSTEGRGMLRTVVWHRDEAVPGYVELQYDSEGWAEYSRLFSEANRLVMPPLLALMAYRLALLAGERPKVNATLLGGKRYLYTQVNLGFTVQGGAGLYLVVVPNASSLSEIGFVNSLADRQRRAFAKTLSPEHTTGATIAFSSMSRWNVSRHVPVLPPHCSLIVGHATPRGGSAVLGASYDHRVLTGYDVLELLEKLSLAVERT